MIEKIIEGDKKYLTEEESKVINQSFEAIDTYLDRIELNAQVIKDGFVTEWIPYTLNKENVKSITVDLNLAYDEFYIETKEPVITQYIDGEPKYENSISIEVVHEEIAEMNDRDFLRGEYNEDTYKVGEADSYYALVGEVNGVKYYYREL